MATERHLNIKAAAALLLASALPLSAGGPGSAGMQSLKSDMSPRAAGMGGAFAAVADDIYAVDYNPAGLGQLYMPEASAVYQTGFDDTKMQHIAYGMPLPFLGLAGLEKPSAALSLTMADAGRFNYRYIMPDGSIFSDSLDAQKDLSLALSYGEKVYSGEVNLEGYDAKIEQYLGANVKYLRSVLLEDRQPPHTFAFDAGWLMMEPKLGLSLGASVANYGGGLKYLSETTPLPATARVGASWQRPTVMDQSVLLAADGVFYTAESLKSLRLGLEYRFQQMFALRLGYRGGEDNSGLTMGFGLRYDDMSLDFATGMGAAVYNSTLLSFSYKFSGITVKEYRKKVKYRGPEKTETPRKASPAAKPARKAAPPPEKKADDDLFWIY